MKRFLIWAVVASSILVAGCGLGTRVQGSGKVVSETRTVGGFDSISMAGNGQLEVDQNGTESLSISADDNILPLLISEVEGKKLVLHVKSGVNLSPSQRIVFKVGARNLSEIVCAGDTSATAKGIHTDSIKLEMAGSGDITAEGTADHQEVVIAGSGKYQGSALKSKSTKINIAGSGDAVVAASDKLDVTVAGSGSIKYIGDPTVTKSILGSGSISKQ